MYKTLNSANVRVDNSVDTDRVYDMAANVTIGGGGMPGTGTGGTDAGGAGTVSNIDSGDVKRKSDGMTVATFNSYGTGNLSINHQNTEAEEQCAVTTAVNAFIGNVKAKVKEVSPVSL